MCSFLCPSIHLLFLQRGLSPLFLSLENFVFYFFFFPLCYLSLVTRVPFFSFKNRHRLLLILGLHGFQSSHKNRSVWFVVSVKKSWWQAAGLVAGEITRYLLWPFPRRQSVVSSRRHHQVSSSSPRYPYRVAGSCHSAARVSQVVACKDIIRSW